MYKPVILLGAGARDNKKIIEHIKSLGVPILLTWQAMDLLTEDSSVFCGRPGIIGQRAANIIMQKADTLITLGARLDKETIGYSGDDNLAPDGIKVVYDIDKGELDKLPSGKKWIKKQYDLSEDMPNIEIKKVDKKWLSWCKDLHNEYQTVLLDYYRDEDYVNPFVFIDWLGQVSCDDDLFALGASGQAPCTFLQAYKVKGSQEVRGLSTFGAMGADIPNAIGASIASGKRTICITGDGGFMLNMQELEVVARENLPIKYFVYANKGYNTIKQSQLKRFGRVTSADPESGFTIPNLSSVAACFGIGYEHIRDNEKLLSLRRPSYYTPDPMIYELNVNPAFVQYPRVDSTMDADGVFHPDPLEDMTPKLDRDVLKELMEYGK